MLKIDLEDLNIISAGAGSGKTYTVQKTLSQWLDEHPQKIRPDRILAVTFTKMAASEMENRIKAALLSSGNLEAADKVASAQISTIHSFGQNIVQSYAYEEGMSPRVRQLSEAEEKILLQLTLSSHRQINTILARLEALGYKGTYNGSEYITSLQKLQSRVMGIVNTLRTIGATQEKLAGYITALRQEIETLYGSCKNADLLNEQLHRAVTELLAVFPGNMTDHPANTAKAGNASAENAFKANHKALKRAEIFENIETDWGLWKSLQSLRTTKIDDEQYIELANAVMTAARELPFHPGPLQEALEHIQILLQISADTLESYNEEKRKNALIDFSDMVHIANGILDEDLFLTETAASYDCLVIDEFQDTNPIQFALLWKFRQAGLPTLIVGDLKQSIMGFQGADASLFASLISSENAVQNRLEANWRSTPELMTFINAMGKGLYGDDYTFLVPKASYTSSLTPLQVIHFESSGWSPNGAQGKKGFTRGQYSVIVQHIQKMIEDKVFIYDRHSGTHRPVMPSDIAILAPKHSMLSQAADTLRGHGLEAQIKQDGWFGSRIVQVAFHTLSYLANASDQHAALYLLTTELGDMTLQDALSIYLAEKKFTHSLLETIDTLRKEIHTFTLSDQLIALIEKLGLWEYITEHENTLQERANLLKLIDLCSEFESLQYESLNALGIYGRNMNSFLAWLALNDSDSQPAPKSINKEAVQLLTWHGSKGLEWPVVVVMGLDDDKKPSLPDISIGYQDLTRDDPLANSYLRFLPEFPDEDTNKKFKETLEADAEDTLVNLLYVSMTRAREQIILPWPEFKEANPGHFSMIYQLMEKCGLAVSKESVTIDHLGEDEALQASVISATCEEEKACGSRYSSIKYGRVAIEKLEEKTQLTAQLSPSTIEETGAPAVERGKPLLYTYGGKIDLSGTTLSAADLGTLIHHCYHTLIADETLRDRLFASLEGRVPNDTLTRIGDQVYTFKSWCVDELKAAGFHNEVPILGTTEQGAVVSGSIDLLVESDEGVWIIDHKTDKVKDFDEGFRLHYPQLEAYARFASLDKPLLGVGINWVRYGKLSLLKR